MKRTGLLCMTALICLLGMMVVGCPTSAEEADTWTAVSSLDQLNGTWKGSASQSKTIKEVIEESGETWDPAMQLLYGDIRVSVSVDITVTLNASAKTSATSGTMTQTYSGGNIDTIWPMFSAGFLGSDGITVDDQKHSITMTFDSPAETLSDAAIAEMLNALQINQHGTKMKVPANTMMGSSMPELILTKQ